MYNLRIKLSSFGYTLDSIQVRDVKLENTVMLAMNKIVETEKLKEAALNEAEAKKAIEESWNDEQDTFMFNFEMVEELLENIDASEENVQGLKSVAELAAFCLTKCTWD